MPVMGPEADGIWTARRIVADKDLDACVRCACGIRSFDMWGIPRRQRDDDLEHLRFRCRRCGEQSELSIQRWVVGHFEPAVVITYISWDDKHRRQRFRPDGVSCAFSETG